MCVQTDPQIHDLERKAPACQGNGSTGTLDRTKGDKSTGEERRTQGLKEEKRRRNLSAPRKVTYREGLSCHRLRQGQSLQLCRVQAQP